MLTYWRSPDYNMTRFLFSWSSAFMLGSMFWNIGKRRESSSDIVMTLAAMFAAVLFAGFQNAATVQPVVATERTVFYREKAAGMYSGLPYAFAQMAMEIPYVFIQTVFYVLIIYSMFGLEWAVDKFFWFFFVAFFTFLYFTYYGMMFVAISPNVQVAGLLCATFFTLFNLFCGFFIPKARIPKWWIWYYWVDPVQWTINGLITTQFGDLEDMITVPGQSSQSIKSYIGDQFGLHLDFMYAVALVLVGFTLLFAFVFAFGIKKLNFQQR